MQRGHSNLENPPPQSGPHMLYNGQINGRNTQLSPTRRLIKHHDTPSTTIAFAAAVSSTSLMAPTSSHQDKICVAGDGNGDVEAQQGLLARSTDQGHSRVVNETRHKYEYEYPTQKLE
jgi:redox-regulated HSP33 family molecular chaperone